MKHPLFILLFFLAGCSTASSYRSENDVHPFLKLLEKSPNQIWAVSISAKVRNSLRDFLSNAMVNRGAIYGDSVKTFDLRNRCLKDMESALSKMKCQKKEDVLKNPQTHDPLRDSDGHTIPMIVYLCDDGGVFRFKPKGDPTNRFRKDPDASKSLRYPSDSLFENFDDEVIKVDNSGHAVPKWPKDLNLADIDEKNRAAVIQDWANDAHTFIKLDCPT